MGTELWNQGCAHKQGHVSEMEDRAKQHFLHRHSHHFVIKTQVEEANISFISFHCFTGDDRGNMIESPLQDGYGWFFASACS